VNKKEKERHYLECFFKKSGIQFTSIRDGLDNGYEPDCFVTIFNEEVGFELTQLFRDAASKGSDLKEKESFHSKRITELAEKYYSRFSTPIRVSFYKDLPDKTDDAEFLNEVAEASKDISDWNRKEFSYKNIDVEILKIPDSHGAYKVWRAISLSVGFLKTISEESLKSCIESKTKRLDNYKTTAKEIVLLIYVDKMSVSGCI